MTVLQKLLVPAMAEAVVERGSTTLVGPVVRAADVVDLSPAALASAHGWVGPGLPWEDEPEFVDVLRFASNPLMDLQVPRAEPADAGRPWPTYPHGFLPGGEPVPVWLLARTRVPVGAEYWRIGRDGSQRQFSFYAGAALGWAGARGYRPPLGLTGPRARWDDVEVPVCLTEDGRGVEVVAITDEAPEGFETTRPGVHRRLVPLAECESVFEVDLRATWRGASVRVLQVAGEQAQVELVEPDADTVARLEAVSLEPGTFEAVAPRAELEDTSGTTRELPLRAAGTAAAPFLVMRGAVPDARFVEPGQVVQLAAPLLATRREGLALRAGARALHALWVTSARPVDDHEVEVAAGTRLRLVETRLVEGIDVHLVVEDGAGGGAERADADALAAAVREALEADQEQAGDADPEPGRYVGDITGS